MMEVSKSMEAYLNVENVLGHLGEKRLVGASKREWLENISTTPVALEHRIVDHVAHVCAWSLPSNPIKSDTILTKGLPVDSH